MTVMRTFLSNARALGYERLISPIRPTGKQSYPTIPLERYLAWSRPDGLPLDPWLRVQARVGGKLLEVCPDSLVIEASVAEWERWTGLAFPESGSTSSPEATSPCLSIGRKAAVGTPSRTPGLRTRGLRRAKTPSRRRPP
ncbi:MAG: hypothetical protein ACRDM7_10980 [Thermoleophilaceae bacterium]